MAITAQTPSILPAGAPALGPAGTVVFGPGDVQEPAFVATVTFTGDGATTAAVVNWIDGTASIPFTPSAVIASIIGGTDTVGVLRAAGGTMSAVGAVTATVNYSVAVANAATSKLLLVAYK
jgi:hypothetical protein